MPLLRQRELALPVAQSVSMTQSQIFSFETADVARFSYPPDSRQTMRRTI